MSERAWFDGPSGFNDERSRAHREDGASALGDEGAFADVVEALCAANERGPGGKVPALLPSRKGLPRHPRVEDDVVIYAGATILGRITIGKGATIGGNVWLTRSVPAGGYVTQARARQDSFENGSGI